MAKIIKINPIGLTKLNNAEYTNFATRVHSLILATGLEVLGIDAADSARYGELLGTMNELVALSRISDETADMQATDKEREEIGIYLLTEIRTKRTSPIKPQASAAQHLYNLVKPYIGFYKLPNQQETVTINGLLKDLAKEEYKEDITTLGLGELIEALNVANARYYVLTEQRTASREAAKLDNSKVVRVEMDELYDTMTTLAFVQSVANPTDATANFVTSINAIITEVITAYNQRVAQSGKKTEGETVTE